MLGLAYIPPANLCKRLPSCCQHDCVPPCWRRNLPQKQHSMLQHWAGARGRPYTGLLQLAQLRAAVHDSPPSKDIGHCKVDLHATEEESWAYGRCHLGASQRSASVWTSSLCPVCTCSQALLSRSEGEWGAKPARPPMARSMVLSLATPLQQCTQLCQAAGYCTNMKSTRPALHLPSSYA